jgi:hypothetical protein
MRFIDKPAPGAYAGNPENGNTTSPCKANTITESWVADFNRETRSSGCRDKIKSSSSRSRKDQEVFSRPDPVTA